MQILLSTHYHIILHCKQEKPAHLWTVFDAKNFKIVKSITEGRKNRHSFSFLQYKYVQFVNRY